MSWYYALSLRAKLLLSFGVVILLTIVITAASLMSMQKSRAVADFLHWSLEERYQRVENVLLAAMKLQEDMIVYINNDRIDSSLLIGTENELRLLNEHASQLQVTRFPQEIGAILEGCEQLTSLFNGQIKPLTEREKVSEAAAAYVGKALPLFSQVTNNLNKVRAKQIGEALVQANSAASVGPMIFVSVLAAVAVVISFIVASLTSSYCKSAINYLIKHVDMIEHQDLSSKIEVAHKDEFGSLANSIENLRNQQHAVISEIFAVSESAKQAMDSMRNDMALLSTNAQETENRSLTAAAAAHQMAETTREISSNCEQAASLSTESSSITADGILKAKDSIKEIDNQSKKTKEDSKQIENLINQSRNISSIVGTIDEIAAQTNLLALNAAIEAARAGEAGRGFAVVADEVRALATRTTSSTNEISNMMELIEGDAKSASDSMTRSVSDMETIATETAALEQVFNDIQDHVNEVNSQITHIAAAVEEQSTASTEISSHIQALTASSQEVARVANDTHDALVSCSNNIDQLYNQMKKFVL